MNHYDTYKPSGIDWIGDVPSHWEVSRIKYLLSRSAAGVWGNDAKDDANDIICYRMADFDYAHGCLKFDNITYRNIEPSKVEGRKVKEGDLLIEKSGGGDLWPVGRVVRVNSNEEATCSNFIHSVSVDDSLASTNFLYYYFHQLYSKKINLLFFNQTTGIQNLQVPEYLSQDLFLPPLSEQEAIAAYLDKRCGEIDKVLSIQERRIELLREMKQSIITRAVTKGINPNAPMKDSGVEWIGEVPEHWEVKRIKHLKSSAPNAFVDGPFGSNLKSQHFVDDGDVYVIESGMITTGVFVYKDFKTITKEHFETIKRSECKAHDIIIAKIGMNYGMGGELPKLDKPSVVSGNSLKITLDNSKILNSLFVYLLSIAKKTGGYIGLVQETAQPALSLSGLNNFALPVAPIEEQINIEAYIEKNILPLDAAITKAQREVELLRELKQATITEVVTGKRKVC